jgi:hypothetical protein
MAGFRHAGPVGFDDQLININDGTTSQTYNAPPGSVGLYYFDEYLNAERRFLQGLTPWATPLGLGRITSRVVIGACIAPDPWVFDIDKFMEAYEKEKAPFGVLGESESDGLKEVLGFIQKDNEIQDIRWIAYMLATLMHECRSAASKWKLTWKPVAETGGANQSYGALVTVTDWKGNALDTSGRVIEHPKGPKGKPLPIPAAQLVKRRYYGRGYVQITHQENYRAMDDALGLNKSLLLDPERALEPEIAYGIMSYGMRMGSFRGKRQRTDAAGYFGGHKLGDYVGAASADYYNARDIINGDKDKTETGAAATNGAKVQSYAEKFEAILNASRVQ